MNRRKFLTRVGASASLAAATPLLASVFPKIHGDNRNPAESPNAGLNSDRQTNTGLTVLQTELSKGFDHPPESAAPWVFWMWIGVDTTPAAMTRDLEQMKAKGIAGFILYSTQAGTMPRNIPKRILVDKNNHFEYEFIKSDDYDDFHTTPIPFPPLEAWSPLWRKRIRYVARESARLGLKFCLTMGLAGTSGSISAEYGNQELIWTETAVSGPQTFSSMLPAVAVGARFGGRQLSSGQASEPGYRRDVAVLAIPAADAFSVNQVIDLTTKMDASGHLTWNPPPGDWKVLRFSQASTGARNQYGYFSDAMNPDALDKLWEVTMAPVLEEMSPEERKGIIGIEDDSWEGGDFTWTKNFPEEFRKRRGYDIVPYLPVLAGAGLGDAIIRQQLECDYKLTISDLMADYHYGHLDKICKQNELIFFSEAAGPNLHTVDLLKTISEVGVPMAEFWMPCFHRPQPKDRFFARNAACASHIYGRPINMDEAFTSMGPEWEESPFSMKPVGDQAFCDGVNRICVHNFSHSPSLTAKPGYVYAPGTHYDPGVTWWEQTPAFNAYLARCSYLLQQGRFVADAIFYKGDNIGDGESMKVIHPTLGEGYDYDCSNTDVLLTRMSVKDGRIVLADGMSYRVLILEDNQPIRLNALEKLAHLLETGATIVGPPPTGLAGLPVRTDEERRFKALVARLWGGDGSSSTVAKRRIGAGLLVSGQTARKTLLDAGVSPDFEQTGLSPAGQIYWIHRRTDDTDIYFVSSHWQPPEKLECTFRVTGKQPELWDPVTGAVRNAAAFRREGARTVIPLEFGPCGSTFVVFRKSISTTASGAGTTNYPGIERIRLSLAGPWKVSFDPNWGGPTSVIFDSLVDWTARPEPGIKYYSGTAVYRKRFDLTDASASGNRTLLDLGALHEVGSVRLNGQDLGSVWTRPARVDITDALKPADNDLEITVVNLWPNRLIGDADLPEAKRFTQTNVHKFSSHSPLLPSGLLGPVRVLSVDGSAQL
jgi:(4-O-methyl)-D-glucuronate---lignin esterase